VNGQRGTLSNRSVTITSLIVIFLVAFPLFRWYQHAQHVTSLQQQYNDGVTLSTTYHTTLDALASANDDLTQAENAVSGSLQANENVNVVTSATTLGTAVSTLQSRLDSLTDAITAVQQQLPGSAINGEAPTLNRYQHDAAAMNAALAKAAAIATEMAQNPFLTTQQRDKGEGDVTNIITPPTDLTKADAAQLVTDLRPAQQAADAARDATRDALNQLRSASVLSVLISP